MKHASNSSLDRLEALLAEIRKMAIRPEQRFSEKTRGVFYYKGRAFLHFHEDLTGLFADLRVADTWERLPVSTQAQQQALLAKMRTIVKEQ